MNVILWILQVLLALHTLIGAVWKLSNSEQTIPSLQALPHSVWMALCLLELVFAVAIVLPALKKNWMPLAALGALGIAAEMLLFTGLHLTSGVADNGPMIYWLIVAAVCGFIAYSRKPQKTAEPT